MSDLKFYALALTVAAVVMTATAAARPIATRGGGTANINRPVNASGNRVGNNTHVGNTNVGNRVGNTNVVNNVNVDVDRGWDYGHPVARGAAFGVAAATTAAITTAAIGSRAYALPPACAPYPYGGYSYYSCGGVYYQPQYQGDSVVYVVVNQPH
jgi:hypothetical protein